MTASLQETHHLASLSSLSPPSPDDPSPDSPALASIPPELQDVLRMAAADADGNPDKLRDLLAQVTGQPQSQDAQDIVPLKGYVIKTALAKSTSVYPSGMKLFINVTHSPYVPAPPMATDDEIKRAIAEAGNQEEEQGDGGVGETEGKEAKKPAWRVPMSLSDVRDDLDKAGRPCLVVDALVNTSVVQKSEQSTDFCAFVVELALSWVEAKHKMSVSREYTIPNMQCKGNPVPHKIYRPKRAGIADTDAVKQTPLYRVRRSAAATTSSSGRPMYTITIQLPLLFTADKVDLHIEERKVLLDHALYSAVIPLSCTVDVDSDECDAAFDKSKRELVVKVPIVVGGPKVGLQS